jgi:hypothetical protein
MVDFLKLHWIVLTRDKQPSLLRASINAEGEKSLMGSTPVSTTELASNFDFWSKKFLTGS